MHIISYNDVFKGTFADLTYPLTDRSLIPNLVLSTLDPVKKIRTPVPLVSNSVLVPPIG